MLLSDFDFELPDAQIARHPTSRRDESRLLHLDAAGGRAHRRFSELPSLLRPGDLLVVNDSAVLPARLLAKKADSGGRVEILLVEPWAEGPVHEDAPTRATKMVSAGERWLAMLGASKRPRVGQSIVLAGGEAVDVLEDRGEGFYVLQLPGPAEALTARYGELPLPPYLGRAAEPSDKERYQTVYANPTKVGSVAAPTAGLHFTSRLLCHLAEGGVERVAITLHVGPGTFLPVRTDRVEDHRMHRERFEISQEAAEAIERARRVGRRVIAVGTTSVRVLESFQGTIEPGWGSTDLFIKPGHPFRSVDAMITNFHLPRSTLIMLVCAFAGRERVLEAYREAVHLGYRFFSYGDAMLVERPR